MLRRKQSPAFYNYSLLANDLEQVSKYVKIICKRELRSAEAESETQEEGANWVGRPAGNSGS